MNAESSNVYAKFRDSELIDSAIQRSVREAVLSHARASNPVAEWRDGKVVWISPEEVFLIAAGWHEGESTA